jgi:hypothetical protein
MSLLSDLLLLMVPFDPVLVQPDVMPTLTRLLVKQEQ